MHRSSFARILVAVAFLLVASRVSAAPKTPIVAVFAIEAKGVDLDASSLDRLTSYLSTSLAATGRYQVVPRDQVKKRLRRQKASSHQRCYDQSCQIEIGKELAAQKSLATQVIKLGTKCALTGTLFDLRRAAAERAATARGGCSEDEIVASLEIMVKKLAAVSSGAGGVRGGLGTSQPRVTPERPSVAGKKLFSVSFRSKPSGAVIFLNGREIGVTNSRINVAAGTYALRLERRRYQPHTARVTITGRRIVEVALKPVPVPRAVRAERGESFGFSFLGGALMSSEKIAKVFGGMFSLWTIKWRHVFWSILEGGAFGDPDEGSMAGFVVSRAGYPMAFGARAQHQLRVGFGVGFGGGEIAGGRRDWEGKIRSDDFYGVTLLPTVEYRYAGDSAVVFGASLHGFLFIGAAEHLPGALLMSISVSFQSPISWYWR